MTKPEFDQDFWEQLWSKALREHGEKVARHVATWRLHGTQTTLRRVLASSNAGPLSPTPNSLFSPLSGIQSDVRCRGLALCCERLRADHDTLVGLLSVRPLN